MTDDRTRVALVHDVFFDDPGGERLRERLAATRRQGAGLAILPELPLNAWCPASRHPREEDAEPPGGPRQQVQAAAAREVGLAVLGGAIVRGAGSGRRHNTALLFDAEGKLVLRYRKVHLPAEEGFWESSHYEPGSDAPAVAHGAGLTLGVQICSDVNRPVGSQLLAAQGVELIAVPRATPAASYSRWQLALRATALLAGAFVASVNRPRPEQNVPIGGPSLLIDPHGEVVAESEDPVTVVTVEREALARASEEYPGYLARPAALYARAWDALATGENT